MGNFDTIATHSEHKAIWLRKVQYLAKPFNWQLFHSYSLPTCLVSCLSQMMPNIIYVCSLTVPKIYCYKNVLDSLFRCCIISFFLFQISILTFPLVWFEVHNNRIDYLIFRRGSKVRKREDSHLVMMGFGKTTSNAFTLPIYISVNWLLSLFLT